MFSLSDIFGFVRFFCSVDFVFFKILRVLLPRLSVCFIRVAIN